MTTSNLQARSGNPDECPRVTAARPASTRPDHGPGGSARRDGAGRAAWPCADEESDIDRSDSAAYGVGPDEDDRDPEPDRRDPDADHPQSRWRQ